jgi:LuxR family maltose regulon positive regulatory protein
LHHAIYSAKGTKTAAQETLAEPLSGRESEVLDLLALGLSYQEIAGRLFISRPTVKSHISHIYGKLDVHSREEALAKASRLGILDG